jgi:hypothetical protein
MRLGEWRRDSLEGRLGPPGMPCRKQSLTERASGTAILAKILSLPVGFAHPLQHNLGEDIASTLRSGWIRKTATNLGRKWLSRLLLSASKFSSFCWRTDPGLPRVVLFTMAPVVSEALHEQALVLWSRAGAFGIH